MHNKEFSFRIDIKRKKEIEPFEVVQGDLNTNVLNITLLDGETPYNLYDLDVEIIFKKSDGTTVQQTDIEKVNDVQGKIKCVLKTNTIACVGKVVAEVKIISDGKLLTSTNFSFYVRKSLLDDETIESTDEFPILTQLIDQTSQLIDEVRQIEEQVPQSVVDRINALETTTDALSTEMVGKVNKSSIANNLVTTESGMVLDARQGKVLQGQITEQNNKLAEVDYTADIVLLNGATIGSNRLMLIKRGKRVMLNAYITLPTPSSSDVRVLQVPLSCRPNAKSESAYTGVNFGGTAGTTPVGLWLYTNGEIKVYVPATKTILSIAITMEWWAN